MTNSKLSKFIREATPDEKLEVYSKVISEACLMQDEIVVRLCELSLQPGHAVAIYYWLVMCISCHRLAPALHFGI